jgi:predicted RNA binding protein YcfA (HicA-like mRNA interferase family)
MSKFKIHPREIREYVDSLIKEGWSIKHGRHYNLFSPTGQLVVIAVSSSVEIDLKLLKNRVRRIKAEKGWP